MAAQNAVTTIVQLSDVVKNGAASLGSSNQEAQVCQNNLCILSSFYASIILVLQVMLINAVKDVTSALGDLMQATKAASGKNMQHPAMHTLKDAAKVSTNPFLQSLLSSFIYKEHDFIKKRVNCFDFCISTLHILNNYFRFNANNAFNESSCNKLIVLNSHNKHLF